MSISNEQVRRIEADIAKVESKIKAYQVKLAQLTERRKQMQERALLDKISEIAPTYDEAQTLLDMLASEHPPKTKNGGVSNDSDHESPGDG